MRFGQLETLYRVRCGKCRAHTLSGFDADGRREAGITLKRNGWGMTRAFGWVCQKCNLDMIGVEAVVVHLPTFFLSPSPCKHEHLNMDGICHACGADCRGIG